VKITKRIASVAQRRWHAPTGLVDIPSGVLTIHSGVRTLDETNWPLVHSVELDAGKIHAPTQPGLESDVDWRALRALPHDERSTG